MKVHIAETANTIEFTVVEREGVSDEALHALLYTLSDGRYARSYPKAQLMFAQDLAQMERNYNAFLPGELHDDHRTVQDLEAALEWVATEFRKRGVRWWLAGSGALYARGLAFKPHDLDVMTYQTELEALRELVEPHIVEPFHHVTDWVVKGFGVVHYRYRLDVAFEPEAWVDGRELGPVDFGPYAQAHLEPVVWHGHTILVPPIELHIAPNAARGRHDRVAAIREYLVNREEPTHPRQRESPALP